MAIYVVYFPRVGKARNTADYAQQVLAGIKDWVHSRWHRMPAGTRDLKLLLRGLHKIAPSASRPQRLPILVAHLRAVRERLDLTSSASDRVFWAFILCCWQGVRYLSPSVCCS